ncbi:MAG: hypothetical protein ABI596_07695 [Pyrinomonadaceae bacterium]
MSHTIIAAVDDMFFMSKIRATAESLNVTMRFVRNVDTLFSVAGESRPALIIVDLHTEKLDPLELARRLKSDAELSTVPLLGFYSHVETELRDQAQSAGFDQIMPRSAFSADLAQILSPD